MTEPFDIKAFGTLPTKRARAVKTRKRMSMFLPDEHGWSKYDYWIMTILRFYMGYREVVKPALNPDGTPALDSFGRPKADPAEVEKHGVRRGAVWFTRETLLAAWEEVIGDREYRDEEALDPHTFEPTGQLTPRARAIRERELETYNAGYEKRSTSHPMTSILTRMGRDGRLIRRKLGSMMISKEECERVGMPEAWSTHVSRGWRWEGLSYEVEAVPLSTVMPGRRAVHLTNKAILREPVAALDSIRNPAHQAWNTVWTELRSHFLFDRSTLARIAIKDVVLDVESEDDPRIDAHITTWARGKAPKIVKVLPRLYQSTDFFRWYHEPRPKFVVPQIAYTKEWIIAWILKFGPEQARNPAATFTARQVLDHFEELLDQDDDWARQNLPLQFSMNTVSIRLRDYVKNGYIINVGTRDKQLSPDLLAHFKLLENV